MVGLTVADEVVTFLPRLHEHSSRETAEQAARDEPLYADMIESWSWTLPLWEAGLLMTDVNGSTPDDHILAVSQRVQTDDRYTELRPLLTASMLDEDRIMRNVARDVLRGGPDPAISVPLNAGLDRFAVIHDAIVMRSAPSSVAQQAEARFGTKIFSVVVPMLLQASARRIIEFREVMSPVRHQIAQSLESSRLDPSGYGTAGDDWRALSAAWNQQFLAHCEQLLRPCEDEDDLHVISGMVSVAGVRLPSDAVLRSSIAALHAISSRPQRRPVSDVGSALPAIRDTIESSTIHTLVCKVIGRTF